MKVPGRRFQTVFFVVCLLCLELFPPNVLSLPRPAPAAKAKNTGDPKIVTMGKIEIARIGLIGPIMEGTDIETLKHAVGHFPDTALPGRAGNVALAAHRDTFFKPLRDIRKGDEITLTTPEGCYRYRVDSTKVVKPENIEVLDPSDESILTLVTCYPFDLRGTHAAERFIVRAHML